MKRVILILLGPVGLIAGCLAPGFEQARSECRATSSGVRVAGTLGTQRVATALAVDPALDDPALSSAVQAQGTLQVEWELEGPHVVEIFLFEPAPGNGSFTLEAAGRLVDRRYQRFAGPDRLSPRGGRQLVLVGRIERGPIILRTDCQNFWFSAIRWTPAAEFEMRRVPALRERLAHLHRVPYFGRGEAGAALRAQHIDQVAALLALSTNRQAHEEGVLGQARAAYWRAAENHRPPDLARTQELFEQLLAELPDHRVTHQMVSASCMGTNSSRAMPSGDFCRRVQPVSWSLPEGPELATAPRWARTQLRLKRRMEAITRWWVEHRQQANGELGGGWGDDVEMLRQWGPLAAGFGSEIAWRGALRLIDGVWNSGELQHGYHRQVRDVEHSAEPSTDTVPLRTVLAPEDLTGRQRLRETAQCLENWLARQPDGHWRFRSSWFNCREVDTTKGRAVDVHLNTRAAGPALWLAYFERDPRQIELLARWAESWRVAMRSTAHQKPFGLIPPVLRSTDGGYLIGSAKWDQPQAEWDYFQWSGESQQAITSLFLALYELTGSGRWRQAVEESFSVLKNCKQQARYCEEVQRHPQALRAFEQFSKKGQPAGRVSVLERLADLAEQAERRLGVNFDMYTSEVLWTDRVYYRLPWEYGERLFGGEPPRGDRYPMFAISWMPVEGEFARAVLHASRQSLELAAYNFESSPITAEARLWRLDPGDYRCQVIDQEGKLRYTAVFGMRKKPQRLRITLPAQTEVTVRVELVKW
ncbi:MAG: hypothetical protein NZV14_09835 [Bryobacteraceae bacterium]|nr:hypothetical protein [Bryobacteraceae bacterium]MDW8378451.1 hypothetical protein [Bryobacterales bacterium]